MAPGDGERILPLATAKDYKRIGDGDTGPNTGGMGAHSPSGVLSAEEAARIVETVLRPAVAGLAAEGRPFVRRPLRRPDADAGRAAGPGVQRPLRRPRGAGDPAAPGRRPAAGPRRRGRGPVRHAAPVLPPGGGGLRRSGEPRLSRPAASGRAHPGARPGGGPARRRGLPRRHRPRRTASWSAPAAGCSRSAPSAPDLGGGAASGPTRPWPRSTGRARSTGATSDAALSRWRMPEKLSLTAAPPAARMLPAVLNTRNFPRPEESGRPPSGGWYLSCIGSPAAVAEGNGSQDGRL